MKNNKLISVLLALLVCLSMVVSASATETELSFTLESDSSVEALDAAVVGVGEEFSVDVNIAANPGILAATAYVAYDNTKLELVSAKLVDGVSNVRVTTDTDAGKLAVIVGDLNAIFGNPNGSKAVTTTGAVAELTFKVLVKADDQLQVNLEVNNGFVVDANGEFGKLTVNGDVLNVNVVSDEHKCDETKTVEANNAVEPTCTEAGKATDVLCAHCGKTLVEGAEIPALDHAWESMVMKAPTCGEQGMELDTCSVCGESKVGQAIPATGEHTFGEWNVTTEPTVEAEGEKTRTCSVCGQEETEAIAKLPPVEQPAPKNNTLLIVVIVVVVLAGAGVAAYFVLKNKKK